MASVDAITLSKADLPGFRRIGLPGQRIEVEAE